jgi:hypothetical protein
LSITSMNGYGYQSTISPRTRVNVPHQARNSNESFAVWIEKVSRGPKRKKTEHGYQRDDRMHN